MSYYKLPKINYIIDVNPHSSRNDASTPYMSFSLFKYYNNLKTQIDTCLNNSDCLYNFDTITHMLNPYAYIYSLVPGYNYSVSKLESKNELFYDFIEIFSSFNMFENLNENLINILHITPNHLESIESINFIKKTTIIQNIYFNNINDDVLKSINGSRFDFCIFETNNDTLELYIQSFIEIVMVILKYQMTGGNTIIKINHLFYKPILDIIYLICSLFNTVYIIKPNTSNDASFDKYLVCKNFLLDDTKKTQFKTNYYKLLIFLKKLEGKNITSIIDFNMPYYFTSKLNDINIIIGQQQLEYFDQIISILKNKNKEDKIETIKKTAIQKCVNWCEKYKIPYNKFNEKTNIFLPLTKGIQEISEIQEINDFML